LKKLSALLRAFFVAGFFHFSTLLRFGTAADAAIAACGCYMSPATLEDSSFRTGFAGFAVRKGGLLPFVHILLRFPYETAKLLSAFYSHVNPAR